MKRQLLLSCSLLLFAPAFAQQVQKCCGTSNSTFLFGSTTYARHSQLLYLPGDLTNAVDGPITHLYFRYGSTGQAAGNTLGNFVVRLGLTNETAFTNGNEYFTGLDMVYSASEFTIAPGTTGEWFWFSLQTPFNFNTNRTLIVDITFETSTTANFGTYGNTNSGRKLVSPDIASPTGSTTSSTWQDMGFDIDGTLLVDGPVDRSASLWPNPATGQAFLRWAKGAPGALRLMLVDASGRMVRDINVPSGTTQTAIDLHGLDAGIYVARWSDADGMGGSARLVKE